MSLLNLQVLDQKEEIGSQATLVLVKTRIGGTPGVEVLLVQMALVSWFLKRLLVANSKHNL